MTRYTYAYGYRSRQAATIALEDMFAAGEVSPGERPKIYRYSCPAGPRWAIDMESD
jgi:hypothetical protein